MLYKRHGTPTLKEQKYTFGFLLMANSLAISMIVGLATPTAVILWVNG
ncbi:hypothetical protein [Flammeovirga aprica]|uniref:Uncharacterized protein n=1 Tax=Flammeovirga aprica JL-4 TaxID=694437 RepID=A0A7X9S165_9BACT|nr:hypothetical protein [Flammeovirga aprica]NME72513.1 hypothetical protein [Flammeovirga aprica JL-4]